MQNYETFDSKNFDWNQYYILVDKLSREKLDYQEYSGWLKTIYTNKKLENFFKCNGINAVTQLTVLSAVLRVDKAYFIEYCSIILSCYSVLEGDLVNLYYKYKLLETIPSFLKEMVNEITPETFQSLLEKNEKLQEVYREKLPFYLYTERNY